MFSGLQSLKNSIRIFFMRKFIGLVILLIGIIALLSPYVDRFPGIQDLAQQMKPLQTTQQQEKVRIVSEESVVIDVVKRVGPSVVTIAAQTRQRSLFEDDPFSFFEKPRQSTEPQNIGTGFIVSDDGLIVTNKHVVSERGISYLVVTTNEKRYKVERVYRDPLNDIAIIKIDPGENDEKLQVVELGDSSKLQVGQHVIAIGTALGEFNNTVTTGVISGLGRGIVAGSYFEGFAERLDDVIQTDAAINPGNSGGPLLNSGGQVIGVNTAVSQSGQNIGFALPINVIKESLKNFNETGQFNRPYLGISYQMISREAALQNDLPEGAYIRGVIEGSAAEKAGLEIGDIITEVDGQKLQAEKRELAEVISNKKVGDTLTLTVWREGENVGEGDTFEVKARLEAAPEE